MNIVIPVGGGSEDLQFISGTATYTSYAAGMSISGLSDMPKALLFWLTSGGSTSGSSGYGTVCVLLDWNGSSYSVALGWDFSSSGTLTFLTPSIVSFSGGVLTVKSGGSRFASGSTWNYRLIV